MGSSETLTQTIAATGLPLVPHLPAMCTALNENGAVILRADPGSGKSTLVPLALMEFFGGKIMMLEPRRAAVVSITSRLAELLGEKIGARAGYSVRLERNVSPQTKIEVITEGLLVRRLQENPALFEDRNALTIIFDEFHERSIHSDLALAFVLDLRRMGARIRLLVMSATMETGRIADCINRAAAADHTVQTPVIDCPGRMFPVDISYRPLPQKAPLEQECAAALAALMREESAAPGQSADHLGDVLVFLPGKREISACARRLLIQGFDKDFAIVMLHGSLPLAQQRSIIAPEKCTQRRVILSTNVAETGLTIPGIRLVVDSGYARIQRHHLSSGMNRLSLESISGNSAQQRAGRAGRLGPGRCIRLWEKGEVRPQETPPEISRIDIAAAVLECLLWGVRTIGDLPWLEDPPQAAWDSALALLEELDAIDASCNPTETGKQIARLGLDPRLGRLCIAGRDRGLAPLACAAAAILGERDDSGIADNPDFSLRLSMLRSRTNTPWAQRITDSAADLLRRLGNSQPMQWDIIDETSAGEIAVFAFPDRIAKRRNDSTHDNHAGEGIFRFPSGREGRVQSPLANNEWLCALEVDSGERMGFIRLALPLSEETALQVLEKRMSIENTVLWNGIAPRMIQIQKAGRIHLGEKHIPCHRTELIPFLPEMLHKNGLAILPWEENHGEARQLLDRIRFFVRVNDDSEQWNDENLIQDASNWLGPFVWNGSTTGKGKIINAQGLCSALENRLGWDQKPEMDRLVPQQFTLPSGKKRHIDYSSGEPVLRLRLQEALGIRSACAIAGVPLVFHLLSPANRPIQITSDLNGFWTGSYAAVRKEMRGRYPKHTWPENPAEL